MLAGKRWKFVSYIFLCALCYTPLFYQHCKYTPICKFKGMLVFVYRRTFFCLYCVKMSQWFKSVQPGLVKWFIPVRNQVKAEKVIVMLHCAPRVWQMALTVKWFTSCGTSLNSHFSGSWGSLSLVPFGHS